MKFMGYWASQEQYSMQDLCKFVLEAEIGGFTSTMTSDHFHPWHHDGGFGNFTWIWLAAAAERTKNMKFITGVTAPIFRYNPAIVAQAFASLDVLYPRRIALGIGTGEAMNEVSVGFDWTSPKIRLERTIESLQIIRKLWNKDQNSQQKKNNESQSNSSSTSGNDFFTFDGQYFKTKEAKLYTPPSSGNIPLYMAASGSEAIQTAAVYTDGLITISKPDQVREVFDKFDKAALEAGKDPQELEKIGKPRISYSEDYDKAFKSSEFWRTTEIENVFNTDINNPIKLQQKAEIEVSDEKLRKSTLIVTSIEDLIKPLEEYFDVGYTQIYLQSTSPDEVEFIQQVCNKVLPYFRDSK
jgi:coenzyme F420-dependent glucose-6-phosphate dehydrogenase